MERRERRRAVALVALPAYERCLAALAACRTTDEAREIRDRATAMRAYARQAKDRSLEADAFEISPTGPLFGSRAPWASGEPGEVERAAVASLGATPESLCQAAAACGFRGERRPLRVRLEELTWALKGNTVTLSFALPPGAYATSVLRELMKMEVK